MGLLIEQLNHLSITRHQGKLSLPSLWGC